MNLSKFGIDWNRNKNLIRWIMAGSVVVFLVAVFVSSFINYKTGSNTTTQQPAYNDEEAFKRLYQDLTKDKPKVTQQKQALAEAAGVNGKTQPINPANIDDWVKNGGWKNTPMYCDSLRVQYAMLAFAFGKLVEENETLQQQLTNSDPKKSGAVARAASTSAPARSSSPPARTATPNSGFDFTQYFSSRGGNSTELTSNTSGSGLSSFSDASFVWATLSLPQKQQIRSESFITLDVDKLFTVGGIAVPRGSKVMGTAQVSQGVGRVYVVLNRVETPTQTITIEGEVYSLDRSRGINVFVHSESTVAEGLKREASDWIGLLDPSRSGVSRNVIQDTDVGREYYATVDAGTMVLAKIRPRQ